MRPGPSNGSSRGTVWPLTLRTVVARCAVVLSCASLIDARVVDVPGTALRSSPMGATHKSELSIIQGTAALSGPGSYASRRTDALSGGSWSLRLCNAYAYEGWVHVFHSFGRRPGMSYTKSSGDGEERLTKASGPLPFKRCTDVEGVALGVGSLLKFRIGGDMHIGTFSVDTLPPYGSMLQLVLKRRDTWSTAADFSSHVFAHDVPGSQVALVNAYLGPARSALEVRRMPTGFERLEGEPGPDEEVQFGTVVDIAAGSYEWRLMNIKGPRRHAEKASVDFQALDRTPYTVLRVGTEAIGGQSYNEELIVWPADGAEVHSGSADKDNPDKGLFGIPKTLGKSRRSQRSSAISKLVSPAILAIVAALSATFTI